jgi:uncharacterized protein (DUF4415 family)
MSKKKRNDDDYDVPELTAEDFKKMRPAREVHPELVEAYLRGRVRIPKAKRKVAVTFRFDPEVATALRAWGPGWQSRVNDLLAKWVKKTPPKRARR